MASQSVNKSINFVLTTLFIILPITLSSQPRRKCIPLNSDYNCNLNTHDGSIKFTEAIAAVTSKSATNQVHRSSPSSDQHDQLSAQLKSSLSSELPQIHSQPKPTLEIIYVNGKQINCSDLIENVTLNCSHPCHLESTFYQLIENCSLKEKLINKTNAVSRKKLVQMSASPSTSQSQSPLSNSTPRSCSDSPCYNGATCIPVEPVGNVTSIELIFNLTQLHGYSCLCPAGYTGFQCQTIKQRHVNPIYISAASFITLLIVYIVILLTLFIIKVKRARAMRGTYSPSTYEQYQVTIPYIIRPPPIERLI